MGWIVAGDRRGDEHDVLVGTSRTPAELAGKFARFESELVAAQRKGVTAGSLLIATAVRKEVAVATRGRNRLSGVGRNGAKVGVRYDVRGTTNPVGLVRATGPLHLIESDTAAHMILPRGVGRAQGRSKAARRAAKQSLYDALFGAGGFSSATPLAMPWGPRFRADHPGTKGKHPWAKGVSRSERLVLPAVQRETHVALLRSFR